MAAMTVVFVALFGLVFGSFLNVVIHRLPRDMSLTRPPSSCPGCGARIKAYDNIPVLSYIVLRGRCRSCGRRISPEYPAVEALTAAGFVLVHFSVGPAFGLDFIAGAVFTCALIALGFIDYHHQILPDAVTLPGLVLALVYAYVRGGAAFRSALLGAVGGAGFLLLVYAGYFLVRKKEGLGMGDVMMMLMVGAYLGPLRTFLVLILGSFVGAIVGVYVMARKGRDAQFALPFGTFLAPAAFVAMLWGEKIVRVYKDYLSSRLG
jgi:leader peptidase (prepilin peptidase) / N-methyltransferase